MDVSSLSLPWSLTVLVGPVQCNGPEILPLFNNFVWSVSLESERYSSNLSHLRTMSATSPRQHSAKEIYTTR